MTIIILERCQTPNYFRYTVAVETSGTRWLSVGQLAELTDEGYAVLVAAAPGHVEQVRRILFDPLTPEQVRQLRAITGSILAAVGNPPPCDDAGDCPGAPAPPLTSARTAGR